MVDDAPGLFFCGLSFQFAFASMVFMGVGRDADFVAVPHRRADSHHGRGGRLIARLPHRVVRTILRER